MEAGTGIEPVFTDLQSNFIFIYINALSLTEYQDIEGTRYEPDTPVFRHYETHKVPHDTLGWPL